MAEYNPPAGFLGPTTFNLGGRASYLSELLTNASGGALAAGEVVRINGDLTVTRAQADAPGNATGIVGVVRNATALGGRGQIVNAGYSFVLLEAALAPAAGDHLWLSATTGGRATNVAPALPIYLGTIKDASPYAATGGVIADLLPGFVFSSIVTLHNVYTFGAVAADQTIDLQDVNGGRVIIDGTLPGYTDAIAALEVRGNEYITQKLGVGTGGVAPTLGALQVTGGDGFTAIPAATAAIGTINSTVGWGGTGFVFSNLINDSFSMVYGTDSAAYFGILTNLGRTIVMRIVVDRVNLPINVVLSTATWPAAGAGAAACLVLTNTSTGPAASVDSCHLYCADNGPGNATLAVYCEQAVVAVAAETLSEYLPVYINGVLKKLALIA